MKTKKCDSGPKWWTVTVAHGNMEAFPVNFSIKFEKLQKCLQLKKEESNLFEKQAMW